MCWTNLWICGCVMNSEKFLMDKDNYYKADIRDRVWKLFYQHCYDLLSQWKMVKVCLENFITYYQITEVLESVLSIRQPLKNFLSLLFWYLYKKGKDGPSCGEKWFLNRTLHTAGIYNYFTYEWIHLKESSIIMFLVLSAVTELL